MRRKEEKNVFYNNSKYLTTECDDFCIFFRTFALELRRVEYETQEEANLTVGKVGVSQG